MEALCNKMARIEEIKNLTLGHLQEGPLTFSLVSSCIRFSKSLTSSKLISNLNKLQCYSKTGGKAELKTFENLKSILELESRFYYFYIILGIFMEL
jgi:hypothetical protein